MIVETSSNQLYDVKDAGADYPQAWLGTRVKRGKIRGTYAPAANARPELVRKAGCKIIKADYRTEADFARALADVGGYRLDQPGLGMAQKRSIR